MVVREVFSAGGFSESKGAGGMDEGVGTRPVWWRVKFVSSMKKKRKMKPIALKIAHQY